MIPFMLVAIGLFLILVEFYVPGGIVGFLGGTFILVGAALFAAHTDSWLHLTLFLMGTIVSIILVIRFALWRIVHANPSYSIYSSTDQEGYKASSYDKSAVGKTGIVMADLKPGGYIRIEGRQCAAISLSGYVSKGEQVTVVGGQEQSLLVQLKNKEQGP